MAVIQNKWVEKEKKKKDQDTAPAFQAVHCDSWTPSKPGKKSPRHTNASVSNMVKTLRGTRK